MSFSNDCLSPFSTWLLAGLLGAFLGAGCASSSSTPYNVRYDAEANTTTYATSPFRLSNRANSSAYGSFAQRRFDMRVLAACSGPNCQPETATLVILTSGEAQVQVPDRSLRLVLDGTSYRWADEQSEWRDMLPDRGGAVSNNELVSVEVSLGDLRRLAEAERVQAFIGRSIEVRIDERDQQRIRQLLARMQDGPPPSDTRETT
jgi:hypothetical protein